MANAAEVDTPVVKDVGGLDTPTKAPYREAVGSLLYVSCGSRPDIAFAVQQAGQHSSAPTEKHWTAVKRILRYLQGSKDKKIFYQRVHPSQFRPVGYCDANFGDSWQSGQTRSITGYIFLLGNAPISWASRKQSRIATSTQEAEATAVFEALKEAIWSRKFQGSSCPPIDIKCDNQPAIAFFHGKGKQQRTKHYALELSRVAEAIKLKEIKLDYINTQNQLADFLTKAVSVKILDSACTEAGIVVRRS